ncbi:hypothetical protein CPS_1874 [Colwellia psychrerythraea 34H]|uniref:AsmA domain-containing protein n=2 Tax=Colwellia psychrerythraea TaxID=28229 RepID=Q484B1_COLP3|nr:hypothetical protein CPS_1874 [Colwellia psychrerythraea 34H]
MTFGQKFSLLNKRIKAIIYSGIVVFLYAISGFFILPLIVKPLIIDTVTEKLERQAQLDVIEFNPFTLSITLKGFSISGKHTDKLLDFDLLTVNLQAFPLLQKTISFDEIIINKPEVSVIILANGEFNFQDIILKNTALDSEVDSENTNEAAWILSIDKFRHNEGIINFSDQNRETAYHHTIKEINVALDNFSTKAGDNNMHLVKAKTSQGTELNWHGKFSLSPLKSSGDISFVSPLKIVSDYLQQRILFNITEGSLKVNSHYDFNFAGEQPQFIINNLMASISALEIRSRDDNKKIITSDELSVDLEQLSSSDKKIVINSISNTGSFIAVNRNKLSQFDIEKLFILQQLNQSVSTDETEVSTESSTEKDEAVKHKDNKRENWDLEIKAISTSNNNIVINDSSVSPIAIHDVTIKSLTIEHLKPFTDELALLSSTIGLNTQGIINLKGTIKPESKQLSLALDTEQISLKDFQPYINSVANMKILNGELATNLMIDIDAAKVTPLLNIKGDIKVSSLNVIETTLNEEFLSWENLTLNDMQFSYPAQRLNLSAININEPFLRLVINEGSTTNIQQLMKVEQADASDSETKNSKSEVNNEVSSAEQSFTADINEINITNGKLDFSDSSLTPKFSAGIYSLNGDITGLSSNEDSRAKIDLKGKVDKYAPVIIKGSVNPLSHDAFTDIDMLFNGIELTTFTPYSGKFAGYAIDKGKLSLGLNYKLSNNKLVAENNVTLDQLTLGEVVNSEEATSLPIKFALSLLKDSDGVIEFNLPIRGDIDNPDFKYSSLVWGALGNLITGIISSPFKALASLVEGDNDNLDHVIFTANSFELNEAEQGKLNSLAKALLQRPSLYIEIRGLSSNLIDHDEMAYAKILKQLQIAPKTLSGVLSEDEKTSLVTYYHSLNKQTAQENPKEEPSNQVDVAPTLTKEDQELAKEKLFNEAIKFMLAETPITDAEYLMLAKQRALQIQKHLIETAQVPTVNVFLLDSSIEIENKLANIEKSEITLPLSLKAK